jgi:hypothetical protein
MDRHTARMRLVAVSIVKNEADIIEPFVRHTLAWADHHLVFDHDSTDGTREILGALRREGLPVTLYTDDALGNLQQARSNHLARLAVEKSGADWVLPLDADEVLIGPGRTGLEKALAASPPGRPASLRLLNYYPTDADRDDEANPLLRLQHCQATPSATKKILLPAALVRDPHLAAGKGNHALLRGGEILPDAPLPAEFCLAHLALRSPQHQVLRVVLAEIQKNSRGQAHAGLDVHYRLGFQLLAENPELFFATVVQPASRLKHQPIAYRGGPLRHSAPGTGWSRVARALLPFLDKLAASHGALLDGRSAPAETIPLIRELPVTEIPAPAGPAARADFGGFRPLSGWGDPEGPVPEAFLPPFHWGYAPTTRLAIPAEAAGPATLVATMLTYSEQQTVTVRLNGAEVARHAFVRVNQKVTLTAPLTLRAGDNELTLDYTGSLVTERDPRRLAVIFLGLRIQPA